MEYLPNTMCVIEDNVSIRKLYVILIKKAGFDVIEFEEGIPALDWLSHHSPKLIVCDDKLPDTSGLEIIPKIRAYSHGKKLPVIAVTGFAQDGDKERYLAAGFNGYLSKPITTSSFVDQIIEIASTVQ
ncbi:MAG TPA: response regulator [Candidatus Kapabacteria bacterium]|nr:response regulator [Candidatus Kapabacteria bacterium]